MKILFNEETHTYTYEDKKVPSVTEILKVIGKPGLIYWGINTAVNYIGSRLDKINEDPDHILTEAKQESNRIKNESATNGKIVHKWIDDYIKGKTTEQVRGKAQKQVDAFLKWVEELGIMLCESERIVFNEKEGYCGTLDILAQRKEKSIIVDIKTSNRIYPEYLLQTAAYQAAYENESGNKIDKRIIVRLDKSGEFETLESDEFEEEYAAFLSALNLYNTLKKLNGELS